MRSIGVLVSALLLVACQQDELGIDSRPIKEGYVSLHFSTNVPAMEVVQTRAVDLDGGGVQNMTLFCFDQYGLFITTASADLKSSSPTSGTFEAQVPEHTRTIHFVANQVLTNFAQDEFRNKSESEVMALLEGSSGRMIYWARFACDATKKIDEQLKGYQVNLLRNHARVSVNNPESNGKFVVTGFAVYNTNAFGTVAPYHPQKGFNFTMDEWEAENFITLPADVTKLSDVTDVTDVTGRYIFECENGADDPVSVILRGHNVGSTDDLYYRIMLIDDKGEQIRLRRNHDYQLNIVGPLSFGQPTFAEAVEAAATNNVWISISDKVNEVEDAHYILKVDKTNYVIDDSELTTGSNIYTLLYSIKGKNGQKITDTDKAEVKWLNNDVALQDIAHDFTVNSGGDEGQGRIRISLLPIGNNEKLEGTLLVKHGRLQRKIKVILVKKQSFVPSWVGTQVYGGMNQSDPTQKRSYVTVMFTVPETCPAELFPMKVYISVGGLDIRAASGMNLTVVREGDTDWYSSGTIKPEPEYKYLYVVEEPGVQRVYFENILSQADGYIGTLNIEAEHFKTMDRNFTYSNNKKSITVTGLKAYNATGGGVEGAADDELVLYRLVPQKKHANVQFDLQLRTKEGDTPSQEQQGTPFNAEEKDEFLLYSQFLDFYTDNEVGQVGETAFDCMFYPEESDSWWKQHNPNAGRMLMFKPRKEIVNYPPDGKGKYTIYLKTNRPKSAEVIRIASNYETQTPILSADAGTGGKYGGNSYRSFTFELANYNPFRFGARAMYDGHIYGQEPDRGSIADVPELITPMKWTYEPDKPVDIAFDVTSFKGSDNQSVDPFGEEFTIYIDAPMLELANNKGLESKLKEVRPGRFAYTVDANREDERTHFANSTVVNQDNTSGVNQKGERKTLHFKVKNIVSAGDIVISSDKNQVVFYNKTFHVTNKPIVGTLQYLSNQLVPKGAFVAFERASDRSRIGAITVNENGQYELRLRKEYAFNWYTDPIVFHYDAGNGNTYTCRVANLARLFGNPNVVLTKPQP